MQYNYNNNYNYTVLSPQQQNLLILNNKKRNIRRTLSGIGFAVFAAELIFQVLYTFILLFLELTGVSDNEFFNDNYLAITELFHGTVLFTALFVIGVIYCGLSNTKLSSVIKFEKVKKSNLILYVMLGLAIGYFGNILTTILLSNLEAIGITSNLDNTVGPYNNLGFLIMTLVTAVVPAFAEEFLFRGVILGKLRKYGDTFAILSSSLLFALMHANLVQIPFAFVGGVFFAFITVKTNSLLPAMIIHFINNLLSCILQYIEDNLSDYVINFSSILIFAIIFALGVFAFIILSIKDKKLFSINNEADEAKEFMLKEKFKFFFSNVGTVLAIVFLILETLKTTNFSTGL